MLALVFGVSTAASAAVLAIFLGGLGLGGALLGKYAERSRRPLELYAKLEIGVALSAAVTPLLVAGASFIYLGLGGAGSLGDAGASIVRVILSALVLGPSVFLMGGTLPAAARAVESDDDDARSRAALLYGLNTTGAVLGALLGTFALFEMFGTRLTLWASVGLNLIVALVALSWGRQCDDVAVSSEEIEEKTAPPPTSNDENSDDSDSSEDPAPTDAELKPRDPVSTAPPAAPGLIYATAGIVGCTFLALELVWYRVLAPILGGSTFTFGLILAVALSGIGAGGLLYSRRREDQPATLSLLTATVALEALCLALPLAFGDSIALLASYLRPFHASGFTAISLTWIAIAMIVVFPASLVSGYQFPVLIALLGRGRDGIARQIGTAYAFNTGGSILGSLAAGFVCIPLLGAITTWRVVGFAMVLLAGVLGVHALRARRESWASVAASGLVAVLAAGATMAEGPSAVWRHSAIGTSSKTFSADSSNMLKAMMTDARHSVAWEEDGLETTVGLGVDTSVSFIINGKVDGHVYIDRGTQAMLGLATALLHPNPKDTFVVGLGTGMTAGWLAASNDVEHVRVLELEPAVVEVAREAAIANHDVLERDDVSLTLGDAREFLLTTDETYDLIVSEPSNPYRAGVSTLFTVDFYEHAKSRLKPGGWFAQWVQGYMIDVRTLRIVMKTLLAVFPNVELWQSQDGDLLVIGSEQPLTHDLERLRQRIRQPVAHAALRRTWLVEDVEGFLSHFVATGPLVERFANALPTPVNTDDHNALEYAFARSVGVSLGSAAADLVALARDQGQHRPQLTRGDVDWSRVDEQFPRMGLIRGGLSKNYAHGEAKLRANALSLACKGRLSEATTQWTTLKDPTPRDTFEAVMVGLMYAAAEDVRALQIAERLDATGNPLEARVIAAKLALSQGAGEQAFAASIAAVHALRTEPFPMCETGQAAIAQLKALAMTSPEWATQASAVLLEQPLAARYGEHQRIRAGQDLAFVSGNSELCVEALGAQLHTPWWDQAFLEGRLSCLMATDHPMRTRAENDLLEFLAATVGNVAAGFDTP